MGEYHTIKRGNTIETACKLGLMDDWRGVRRQEAVYLERIDAQQGTNIKDFLEAPETCWRFPWPWEDVPELNHAPLVEAIKTREIDTTMSLYPSALPLTIRHKEMIILVEPHGGGVGVQMWFPCPIVEPPKHMSLGGAYPCMTIYGERYAQGQARTIFQCAWCRQAFSLNSMDLSNVVRDLRDHQQRTEREWHVYDRFQPTR